MWTRVKSDGRSSRQPGTCACWGSLGCALLLLGLVLLASGPAWADRVRLDLAAQSTESSAITLPPDQLVRLDQACILLGEWGDARPPRASQPWLHLRLPHEWRKTHPEHEGVIWYRFTVNMPKLPSHTWAVHLPRVSMNGQVWINDVSLGYSGSMADPVTRNWYVPLIFSVPTQLWKEGENTIYVKVASAYLARMGLAPIELGPAELVAPSYQWRHWLQVDGLQIIHVALIAIGLLLLLVWLRDRSQAAFGYMGMSSVFWGGSTLVAIATEIPTSAELWDTLSSTLIIWHQLALTAFFFRFAEFRAIWLYRFIAGLAVGTPLFFLAWEDVLSLLVLSATVYLLALVGMACMIWHVVHRGRPDGWWMVLGCLVIVPCGWHDVMVGTGQLPFGTIYWLALMGPSVIVFSCVVLAGDYARSRKALHDLNRSLAFRVAERESELRESFERLTEMERSQAVSAERSRILRDMHDGVGAHLTSALRQLQVPDKRVDLGLVTQTLRDSLDQLKLSVDALSLMPGDVMGLLASLRFRITPRLKAAGLELVWDVTDLPSWPDGQAPALRQLQYILFEGLSNVLQHSGATRLVLMARGLDDHIQLSLIDNGRGWSVAAEDALSEGPQGHGLQAMRARASVIGAKIEFRSAPEGGAELRVILPIRQARWSDMSSAA